MRKYVLYNPLAGNGTCEGHTKKLSDIYDGEELIFCNISEITDYKSFFDSLKEDDKVILCGGDGTLNRFVNSTADLDIRNELLYYGAGSGNDFLHDLGKEKGAEPFPINDMIRELPVVEVNGRCLRFFNGVGMGIEGYCCAVGEEKRKKSGGKPVNYTGIAIKGVLGGYKPCKVTVIVDGAEHSFDEVWLAPVMFGRFFGGGMNAVPMQDRNDPEGKVSLMIWRGSNRLKTLMIFPSIFEGKHVSHTEHISLMTGHEITVRAEGPSPFQIDGDTIPGVSEFTVKSKARVAEEAAKKAVTV